MLQISKEVRDLVVSILGHVRTDNVNFDMTVKGLIVALKDLREVEQKKTLDEALEEKL
jgi:hypothetical protein